MIVIYETWKFATWKWVDFGRHHKNVMHGRSFENTMKLASPAVFFFFLTLQFAAFLASPSPSLPFKPPAPLMIVPVSQPVSCRGRLVNTNDPCSIHWDLHSNGFCKYHDPDTPQCRRVAISTGVRCRISWHLNANEMCEYHEHKRPQFPLSGANAKATARPARATRTEDLEIGLDRLTLEAPKETKAAKEVKEESEAPKLRPRKAKEVAKAKMASKKKEKPRRLTEHPAVISAVKQHQRVIQQEERALGRILAIINGSVTPTSEDIGIQRAVQAKLLELQQQLDVFRQICDSIERRKDLSGKARYFQIQRELFRFKGRLPAFAKRLDIEEHVTTSRFTIVQGQTGSGKSTQVPQYLAELRCFANKRVLCTQPRKLAAINVAKRVAYEFSGGREGVASDVGRFVGYRVGGEYRFSRKTRIEFVTEAVLLDMIARATRSADDDASQDNPFKDVGCVIIDEAHERSIVCDLLMGSLKQMHPMWGHVKVVITSATIDLDLFSSFFDNAPVVEIQGRMFPVDIVYCPVNNGPSGNGCFIEPTRVASAVAQCALMIHQQAGMDDGDILCFLPGQDDVLRAKELFEHGLHKQSTHISSERLLLARPLALYGKQDPEEQALVFEKHKDPSTPKPRKVIFSTDVAETSITIDGVVFVVDSGLKKAIVYDPIRSISSLKVHTVCRSSAIQRAGRAGRTQPGKCFRLYAAQDFEEMDVGDAAEVFRRPLCLALLTLYDLGLDSREFDWIEPPNKDAIHAAEVELRLLNALDSHNQITQLGKQIAELQIDPKLVRMIAFAAQQGMVQVGIDLAAVLSVANFFFWRGGKDAETKASAAAKRTAQMDPAHGDVVSLYRLYTEWTELLEGNVSLSSRQLSNEADTEEKNTTLTDSGIVEDDEEDDTALQEDFARQLIQIKTTTGSLLRRNVGDDDDDDDSRAVENSVDDATSEISFNESEMSVEPSDLIESEVVSPPREEGKAAKRQDRFQRERMAKKWCLERCVNNKAVGMARSFASELKATLKRSRTWKVDLRNDIPDSQVKGDVIRRILTAGFFMNASVLKPRGRRGPEYFVLHSGAVGALFFGSALHQKSTRDTENPTYPPLVIFDSNIRLAETTYLSLATPIDESWIAEESSAFRRMCEDRKHDLPICEHEWKPVPFEIIRNVFGKGFRYLSKWEQDLSCSLIVDLPTSRVTALFAPRHKYQVVSALEERFAAERLMLERETIEEVYQGNTRAVISAGFQVRELLFGQDFTMLCIRNWSQDGPSLKRKIELIAEQEGLVHPLIDSFHTVQQDNESPRLTATVKFASKFAAHVVLERLRGEYDAVGGVLDVVPRRNAQPGKEAAREETTGKLKLTWANGTATGGARLWFRSADQANHFLRSIDAVFPGIRVKIHPCGTLQSDSTDQKMSTPAIGAQRHPKAFDIPLVKEWVRPRYFRVLFDVERIATFPIDKQATLQLCVCIKSGLPLSMDEHELTELVNRYAPVLRVRVERKESDSSTTEVTQEGELETRLQRMLPLLSFLDNTAVHTDFIDKLARRAGVMVHFRDVRRLDDVFLQAMNSPLWSELEKPRGQPIRLAVEYTYTSTMHIDLYECFRRPLSKIIASAKKRGILCQELLPTRAAESGRALRNVVTLKFSSSSRAALRGISELLNSTLACEKVGGELVHHLFSITGRRKVQMWVEDHSKSLQNKIAPTFVRWIQKTKEFWVYGEPEHRAPVVETLQELAAALNAVEVLDRMIRLDLRKFTVGNFNSKPNRRRRGDSERKVTEDEMRNWVTSQTVVEQLYHYSLLPGGRVVVSGSEQAVEAVETAWKAEGKVFELRSERKTITRTDCGVCYLPADEPSVTLTMCNHVFCVECILLGIRSSAQHPFPCPAPDCGQLLHVNDMIKIVGASDVDGLIETAVFDFVAKHPETCAVCPKPGCNQVLSLALVEDGDEGGRFIFCDVCAHDYCLDCSSAVGKAMDNHFGTNCEDFQAGQLTGAARHVKYIQERICNLSCPICRVVFLDFTGCTSVQCGNPTCNQHFCANCLEYASPSGADTHKHVRRCSKNPGGSYFVLETALAEAHRSMRTDKLVDYLTAHVSESNVRAAVLRSLAKELHDLRIEIPAHLRVVSVNESDAVCERHVHHIREELLNLRCPKCRLVFVDFEFESCAALTCASANCTESFCAYCLAPCGQDAHKHVQKCEKNPNLPYYFTTEADFLRIHRERRQRLIQEYVDEIKSTSGNKMAQCVCQQLASEFRQLELEIQYEGTTDNDEKPLKQGSYCTIA
ncbi:hypothetical protein Poli38472_009985 [Pythium oligandrum]|uniref:Uncharacterized protein n=1 Tax=Pythium oligandrum TaxID=41045 RepID=A0A8K1FDJ2_PYTOL|nr:hypothetical protein Poli38472_009985 [Pythium oligandrum]|eukprot:TMW58426.1 hypothetical protein Poli38472_009985 [Pythium oligandrum]